MRCPGSNSLNLILRSACVKGAPLRLRKTGCCASEGGPILFHFCQLVTAHKLSLFVLKISILVFRPAFSSFGTLTVMQSLLCSCAPCSTSVTSSAQAQNLGSKFDAETQRISLLRNAPKKRIVHTVQIRRFSYTSMLEDFSASRKFPSTSAVAGWRLVLAFPGSLIDSLFLFPCNSILVKSDLKAGQLTPCCRCSCLNPDRYTEIVACETFRVKLSHRMNLVTVSSDAGSVGAIFFSAQNHLNSLLAES